MLLGGIPQHQGVDNTLPIIVPNNCSIDGLTQLNEHKAAQAVSVSPLPHMFLPHPPFKQVLFILITISKWNNVISHALLNFKFSG